MLLFKSFGSSEFCDSCGEQKDIKFLFQNDDGTIICSECKKEYDDYLSGNKLKGDNFIE